MLKYLLVDQILLVSTSTESQACSHFPSFSESIFTKRKKKPSILCLFCYLYGSLFFRYLQEGTTRGLTGQTIMGGLVEKSLITHFEVLNLVPVTKRPTVKHESRQESFSSRIVNTSLTKWRRVGFISGRNVHLDTIVWPSGDIVVTGN